MTRHVCLRSLLVIVLATWPTWTAPAEIDVAGTCTLVEAIHAANNDDDSGGLCPPAGPGPDTIRLSQDVALLEPTGSSSFYGDYGLPVITTDIVIDGGGFTVRREPEATPRFGLFYVRRNGNLVLSNVTLEGGAGSEYPLASFGGAVTTYGGTVRIENAVLRGNTATYGGAVSAIYGSVDVVSSTLTENSAEWSGGAVHDFISSISITDSSISENVVTTYGGGAVAAFYGGTTIAHSVLANNSAPSGGAVAAAYEPGEVVITDSTLVGNTASHGGAIENYLSKVTLTRSTLAGNEASFGGGIYNRPLGPSTIGGDIDINNTTFSANRALATGGGISNHGGRIRISHSTFVGNEAEFRGGAFENEAVLELRNSILVNSVPGGNCFTRNPLITAGANFDDDGTCAGALPVAVGVDVDPLLSQRAGPTPIHALLPGSVAIDAVSVEDCIDTSRRPLKTDQRGLPRPIDGDGDDEPRCDSGSVELEPPLLAVLDSLTADVAKRGVWVRWRTVSEIDTVGFRVLRQQPGDRVPRLLTAELILARGSELIGADYQWLDRERVGTGQVSYFVEDVDHRGVLTRHGPVVVTPTPAFSESGGLRQRQ